MFLREDDLLDFDNIMIVAIATTESLETALRKAGYVGEYLGLIGGPRRVISYLQSRSIRHFYVSRHPPVTGKGTGHHRPARTTPSNHLHNLSRFLDVDFDICRHMNKCHSRPSSESSTSTTSLPKKTIFYTALLNSVDAWVEGVHTLASQDLGTAGSDPNCFNDGSFLYNLPDSPVLFRYIQDPHPLSITVEKARMTVLGTISSDIAIHFSHSRNAQLFSRPDRSKMVDVVVMRSLPVPIRAWHRNPQIG